MEIKSLYDLWRNTSRAGKIVLVLLFLMIISPSYLQVIAPKVVADIQTVLAPQAQLGKVEHAALAELKMMDTLQSRLPLNDQDIGTYAVVDMAEYELGERVIVAALANWDVFEEDRYVQGTGGNGVLFLIGEDRKSRLPFNAQEVLVAGLAPAPYGDDDWWSSTFGPAELDNFIVQQEHSTKRSSSFVRKGVKSCEADAVSFSYAFARDGWLVTCRQDSAASGPWTVLTCLSGRGQAYWTSTYWLPVESDIFFTDMTNDGEPDFRISIAVWSGEMAHANRLMIDRVLNLTASLTAGSQVNDRSLVAHNLSQFERACVDYRNDPYLHAMWLLISLDGASHSVWPMSDGQYVSCFRSFVSLLDDVDGEAILVMLVYLTIGTSSYQPMVEEARLHDYEKETSSEDPWDRRWILYGRALLRNLLAPSPNS